MSEWQSIETAPKDGTIILVKNPQMDHPMEARWGEYRPSYGGPTKIAWSVWRDLDKYPCVPRGALVIPTHWMPPPSPPSEEQTHDG